jgi:hypothetical protein
MLIHFCDYWALYIGAESQYNVECDFVLRKPSILMFLALRKPNGHIAVRFCHGMKHHAHLEKAKSKF